MDLIKIYEHYLQTGKVTTDTRNCPKGAIYFALKGERFDGNNFAIEAIEKGCSMAIVDDQELATTNQCLWVPDALKALQQLAMLHRQQTGVKVIGITGSNGKTTTKELIAEVLRKKYQTWFTQGNLNNHIGVPLTLLATPPGTQLAVIEMGANHLGEIAQLSQIAQPDMGLITNVGKAHIEGFGSFEGVKTAKGELYEFLRKNRKEIFINGDNHHLAEMLGEYNGSVFKYGNRDDFEVTGRNINADPLLNFEWKSIHTDWQHISTQLTGEYNYENVMAAIAIGLHFGVPVDAINEALRSYQPINHRSQIINSSKNTIVLDAYNANPSSMEAALNNLSKMKGQNKILILGEMKELGDDSLKEHASLIKKVIELQPKTAYLIGSQFKELMPVAKNIKWLQNAAALRAFLENQEITNSIILIKGSRANKLEELIDLF